MKTRKLSAAFFVLYGLKELASQLADNNKLPSAENTICFSDGNSLLLYMDRTMVLADALEERVVVDHIIRLNDIDLERSDVIKSFRDDILPIIGGVINSRDFAVQKRFKDIYKTFEQDLFRQAAMVYYDTGRGFRIGTPIKSELAFMMMAAFQMVQKKMFEDNALEDNEIQDNFRAYLFPILAKILKEWGLDSLDEDACVALDVVSGYWEYEPFDICRGVISELEKLSEGN